jgi:hypothetical protein
MQTATWDAHQLIWQPPGGEIFLVFLVFDMGLHDCKSISAARGDEACPKCSRRRKL